MSSYLPLNKAPEKLCILRLSALGDVTHVLPVVRAIQARWPGASITWICGKLEKKLMTHIEGIRFIEFDKKQGWRAYASLRQQLKDERFDVLLHMQVALRANLASLCIKADVRLGWDVQRSRDFHQFFTNHNIPPINQQHQVQGFLSFARCLGIEIDEPKWDFPISEEGHSFAGKYVDKNKKTLLISPCSSHKLRNWHAQGYAEVADYAVNELGMQVILSGGPSTLEIEMAEAIESYVNCEMTNLVGKDTLQQLLGLLEAVDIVISPDSGPAHIANAVGTPVIGLYACTWSLRSGPYNSLNYCVDKFEAAAKKYRNKSAEDLRWGTKIELPGVMDLIEPGEVIERLNQLVQSG